MQSPAQTERDRCVLRGGIVCVGASGPAAQVGGALVEELAVAWRKEVGGEDDKGTGPHHKGVLHTPPLVVVEVPLTRKAEKVGHVIIMGVAHSLYLL